MAKKEDTAACFVTGFSLVTELVLLRLQIGSEPAAKIKNSKLVALPDASHLLCLPDRCKLIKKSPDTFSKQALTEQQIFFAQFPGVEQSELLRSRTQSGKFRAVKKQKFAPRIEQSEIFRSRTHSMRNFRAVKSRNSPALRSAAKRGIAQDKSIFTPNILRTCSLLEQADRY